MPLAPFVDRFWRHVRKGCGCWEWTGATSGAGGYGKISMANGTSRPHPPEYAHRIAWMLMRGDPGYLLVLHRCDNRLCVRPDHLFLGTHQDNCDDKIAKGRARYGLSIGEAHGNAKLTDGDVEAILAALHHKTQTAIAREYAVSVTCINSIAKGKTWKHIERPRG